MTGYVIRRLLLAIPTLFVMLTAIFVLVRLVPGDAASVMLGDQASAASLAALRSKLGLDQPVHVQYLKFLGDVRWFPVLGNTSGSGSIAERLRALALPALNLGIIMTAYVMRVSRAAMLGVLTEDYIRTARAKGVSPTRLVLQHALRNSLIPIITVVGLYFGTLTGNSVLTEIIFNRPGLGKLILGALNARDYTLLQGLMIIFAICVIVVNTLTDLAYGLVDPRVKYT